MKILAMVVATENGIMAIKVNATIYQITDA